MSNISADEGGSFSSGNTTGAVVEEGQQRLPPVVNSQDVPDLSKKKKRSLPGTPDPNAQVIALSPTSLMAKNKYICEICNKGFQRDQNLQLHRRGHNLPWKLRQRTGTEIIKRVYICPEPTCVHHNPARALGDLTGIKKHYSRKHGEKNWKCEKCCKRYAVQCDWKAHSKICGTKEYKCDCGTIFSRRDSFITHRAFCDALAEENNKLTQTIQQDHHNTHDHQPTQNINLATSITSPEFSHGKTPSELLRLNIMQAGRGSLFPRNASPSSLHLAAGSALSSPLTSATALLQKAAKMGATSSNSGMNNFVTTMAPSSYGAYHSTHTLVDQYHPHQSQISGILGGEDSLSRLFNPSINGGGDLDAYSAFLNTSKEAVNDNNISHNANAGLSDSRNSLLMFKKDGNGDNLTVDFMGVGGMRIRSYNEQHHQGMEI
ncbi:putative transcription factor C2H2 family [Helianthus annuus]|nr:putative transcription factor C2H2 family [Helianthus annuus]KAJ0607300.1 putative transcription factor C2H2 family [Helianthus annuus]KAJ0767360.1 putative transcription factor C2H2 family [Helianthus annuus]KAJ0773203.1 putative transcription factor C2H2 family [Helianthus annuus]KAJ0942817.1 putative transcription factor C2H2 family [Helianthus annuus]